MKLNKSYAFRKSGEGATTSNVYVERGHVFEMGPMLRPGLLFSFDIGTASKAENIRLGIAPEDYQAVLTTMMTIDREATIKAFAKAALKPVKG